MPPRSLLNVFQVVAAPPPALAIWPPRLILFQSLVIAALLAVVAMARRKLLSLETPALPPDRRSSLAFAMPPTPSSYRSGGPSSRLSVTQCLGLGEDPVAPVLHALQLACKQIAAVVRQGAALQPLGTRTGDVIMLNIQAHEIFVAHLRQCPSVTLLLSEPCQQVIEFDRGGAGKAQYAVVCDPLDGASNMAAGVSTGFHARIATRSLPGI